jgi:multicomponent Na+:H+ antiporter subunit A
MPQIQKHVILNGVIGFVVTLFFIAMKAPDLALTQLVVETITTMLNQGLSLL